MDQQEPRSTNSGTAASGDRSLLDQAIDTPQAAPAVGRGPDSHSLPRTPVRGEGPEDWQAAFEEERQRRQGVDRRLQQLQQDYESRLNLMEQALQRLSSTPQQEAGPKTSRQDAAPDAKAPAQPQATSQTDALEHALSTVRAVQYRDALIDQMTRAGGELEDLRGAIDLFADQIPTIPPSWKDGQLDNSSQVEAIKAVAGRLRTLQQQTQQQTQETVLRGMTPGSSPGQPPENSAAELYEEFTTIMELMGSEEWDNKLSKGERNQLESRYFELLEDPIVQNQHGGQTRPTMDWNEMQESLRALVKQVNAMQGTRPFGNMG